MAEVALRERIDADLGTLFEFQADPEASAMAAFPSRDLPAFLEHEAKIKACLLYHLTLPTILRV
jgi:hypothetical protein